MYICKSTRSTCGCVCVCMCEEPESPAWHTFTTARRTHERRKRKRKISIFTYAYGKKYTHHHHHLREQHQRASEFFSHLSYMFPNTIPPYGTVYSLKAGLQKSYSLSTEERHDATHERRTCRVVSSFCIFIYIIYSPSRRRGRTSFFLPLECSK